MSESHEHEQGKTEWRGTQSQAAAEGQAHDIMTRAGKEENPHSSAEKGRDQISKTSGKPGGGGVHF